MNGTRTIDVEGIRGQILDPARTVAVVRGMVPDATLARYLAEAEEAFATGPRTKEKPAADEGPDRVLPWLWDHGRGTFMVHRLYRFVHNEAGTVHGDVHGEIMALRDEIESAWPNREAYARHGMRSLHMITKYEHGAAGYPRHHDMAFGWEYPMLQCWLQLSEPGRDFAGGDLILHPPGGAPVAAIADLGIRAGDVLFFDKRTEHEVSECEPVEGGRGRWIAIVGAMAVLAAAREGTAA